MRQLRGVYHPVTERGGIILTRILHAEPSVVHDEKFATHIGDILHHLPHSLFIYIEIYTFPAVEKHLAQLVTIGKTVITSPFMEITACTTKTLLRVGQCKSRSDKFLTLLQIICGVLLIYSGKEMVIIAVISIKHQFEIATVAQRRTNHTTMLFLTLTVKRHHHLGMRRMGIAHTILILYHLQIMGQRSLLHFPLICP